MFFRSDTVYAPNYSEEKYEELNCAMTAAQVRQKLGVPLEVRLFASEGAVKRKLSAETLADTDLLSLFGEPGIDKVDWWYSAPKTSTSNYQVRVVTFLPDGRVNHVSHSFYLD